MIYRLIKDIPAFPDPRDMDPADRESDGCFAIGGDLSPQRLQQAYAMGIFPWSDFRGPDLYWYCPQQRFVIFPNEVHISHSMRTLINKGTYRVSIDEDFTGVIDNCSQLRIKHRGAWLGPRMVKAYTTLHHMGIAHSIEVWRDERLVGGLYGVAMLNGFMGESMFSLEPNTSKLALISLCQMLERVGAAFVDCQLPTDHLTSMGARLIPYQEYLDLLWGQPGGPDKASEHEILYLEPSDF